jgi:prepilin-type N-terminal cleavage/methylation domain-containing protein
MLAAKEKRMKTDETRMQSAFTLIELLVVIAIISILAAILFPVFAGVREKARLATSQSNMKQILTAVQTYVQDYDEGMPFAGDQAFEDPTQNPSVSVAEWQEQLYPYIKSEKVYIDPNESIQQEDDWSKDANFDGSYPLPSASTATSYLFNGMYMGRVVGSSVTTQTGVVSATLAQFSDTAGWALLTTGQRQINDYAGVGVGASVPSGAPDHNGNLYSPWRESYNFTKHIAAPGAGGGQGSTPDIGADGFHAGYAITGNLFDPCGFAQGAKLPHHQNGHLFGFLDGHVKFIPLGTTPSAPYYYQVQLEKRLPACHSIAFPQDSPDCQNDPATGNSMTGNGGNWGSVAGYDDSCKYR